MNKIFKNILWICLSISLVIVLLFVVYHVFRMYSSKQVFDNYRASLPDYNHSKVLVFKEIDFYKYVVYGKPENTEKHLDFLEIYLLKGRAVFGFDFSNVQINNLKTNYANRILYVDYKSSTRFPVYVDISIPAENVSHVESITSMPVTQEEAEKAAKIAATVTGTAGALLGGFTGSKFSFNPVKKIAGGAIGAVAGGTALAASSYVMTKNLLLDFQAASSSVSDIDNLIESSKILIALELLGKLDSVSDPVSLKEWEKTIINEYSVELTKALESFFKPFGWKSVIVNFENNEGDLL
jgi:outer membrane lipoprotein SlyB